MLCAFASSKLSEKITTVLQSSSSTDVKIIITTSLFLSGIETVNTTTSNATFSNGDFRPVKPRKTRKQPPKRSDVFNEDNQSDEEDCGKMSEEDPRSSSESPKLFACPNEGCIRVYKRYSSMINHAVYGKCELQLERESLLDTAKIMYSKKLWGGESIVMDSNDSCAVVSLPDFQKKEEEGWALRSTKKANAFSEKQRNFLEDND